MGLNFAYSSVDALQKTKDFVPHELIVKFKNSNQKASLVKMGAFSKKRFRASGAQLLKFSSVIDLNKTIGELKKNSNVEYVEHNAIYKLMATPNDPNFSRTYGMNSMSMPQAWDTSVGSKAVVVGVIDTGIDYNHPDLAANYWANPGEQGLDVDGNDKSTNGLDDDLNGYVDDHRGWDFINGDNDPMDGNGHGTHCAGTIGAVGNNEVGVAGVNWDVSLVGLKIFSDAGSTTIEAITEAIEYSTTIGVDVTNNSWGGGAPSETIKAAIVEAGDAGILFIAAAGNSSSNNDNTGNFPSNYKLPNIIAVAATDSSDRLASFSSYGKKSVHVAAPGVQVYSTRPRNRYQNLSGTSMATPHITGLVAFIKSVFPEESMFRVKSRVIYTGDDVPGLKSKVITGKRANGLNAIQIDEVGPAGVESLTVVDALMDSFEIEFSESGDDGLEGSAFSYSVRISDAPITEENWEAATLVSANSFEVTEGVVNVKIEGLSLNTSGFVAVKAFDDVGNPGVTSESIEFSTLAVEILAANSTDSLDGVTVTGPWGLETLENGNVAFSDSPDGPYANRANFRLTLDPMTEKGEKTFLRLVSSYDLERRYDFGFVEVSTDGTTWKEVQKFNGNSGGFITSIINITDEISGADSYQVRFRIMSDTTQNADGWKIDEINVLGNLSL